MALDIRKFHCKATPKSKVAPTCDPYSYVLYQPLVHIKLNELHSDSTFGFGLGQMTGLCKGPISLRDMQVYLYACINTIYIYIFITYSVVPSFHC